MRIRLTASVLAQTGTQTGGFAALAYETSFVNGARDRQDVRDPKAEGRGSTLRTLQSSALRPPYRVGARPTVSGAEGEPPDAGPFD